MMDELPGRGEEFSRLVARDAVRDLVHRSACAVDSGRFDEALSLFAEDATFELGGHVHRGHDAIRRLWASSGASLPAGELQPVRVRHMITTQQIDILSPESAMSRSYFLAMIGDGIDHWGRYIDRFGIVAGQWRFTSRFDVVEGVTPGGWAVRG